jgi:tRNA(Leu) C34 or U34 (ribose-2'-O)-methylase TrmL
VHGVIYPVRRQAPLSAAAIKASAGAVEHLLLVPVEDLAEALTDLHVRGLRVIGSDAEASLTARQADLRGPVVVVVGSEGQGLGPAVRRRCDTVVKIPMRGRVSSLNAAVAGSILLYEASSQRGGERPQFQNPFTEPASSNLDLESDPVEAEGGPATEPVAVVSISGAVPEAGVAAQDAALEPATSETAPAPAPKPKARRRPATTEVTAEAAADPVIESEEDALLPGSAAIDSSDAATAE